MEISSSYQKLKKTKSEEYLEKLQKRNETQDWIFGNCFGKQGAGAPLRDSSGNVISTLKTVTNDNIYRYTPKDFIKSENNNNNIEVSKNNYSNNNSSQNNNAQINYYYPLINQNINIYPYMISNNQINQINQMNYNNNNQNYFMDLDATKKDNQKFIEKEKYRRELMAQIAENANKKNLKRKQIDEQNRIDELKNQEYFKYKEKQEEEYKQKLKSKKNRILKSSFGTQIIKKDNENKSENSSLNNSIQKNESNNNIQNPENEYQSMFKKNTKNMFEEKEDLKTNIDNNIENILNSIDQSIDMQKLDFINNNKIINNPYKNNNENQFINNILNDRKSPPTPMLLNLRNSELNKNKINMNLCKVNNIGNEKKNYYIPFNEGIHNNIQKEYDFLFKELEDMDNFTKNYREKISPKFISYTVGKNQNRDYEYYNEYNINNEREKDNNEESTETGNITNNKKNKKDNKKKKNRKINNNKRKRRNKQEDEDDTEEEEEEEEEEDENEEEEEEP